jgi:ATP-dependent RNA helicase DDX3X
MSYKPTSTTGGGFDSNSRGSFGGTSTAPSGSSYGNSSYGSAYGSSYGGKSTSSTNTGSYGNSNSGSYGSGGGSGGGSSYGGSGGSSYNSSYGGGGGGGSYNSSSSYGSGGGGGSYNNSSSYGGGAAYDPTDAYTAATLDGDVAPVIDPNSEHDLFAQHNNVGINFQKYADIPVTISGENAPLPIESFSSIKLSPSLVENIQRAKYEIPTPVQKYSIPSVLASRDLMACAQTGSGKTAAFLVPVIERLLQSPIQSQWGNKKTCPRTLILSPTRELASQIHVEVLKFCYKTNLKGQVVYGGASSRDQQRNLQNGCDILVGTPGRLIDMIDRGIVALSSVRFLILDEADRMLDMGFEKDIRKIVEERDMPGPEFRTTLMFSATFPKDIRQLATDFLKHNHLFLKVGRVGSTTESIKQNIKLIQDREKQAEVLKDIKDIKGRTLIFAETKKDTDQLARFLFNQGFQASGIHGDRSQNERESALRSFKSGRIQILVATDVAARGLDIEEVQHVINYDLPKTIDSYVHRIGRTGRAGNTGVATSYFNDTSKGIARDLIKLLTESKQFIPAFLAVFQNEPRGKFGGRGFGGSSYGGGGSSYGGGGSSYGSSSRGGSSFSGSSSRGGSSFGGSSRGGSSGSSFGSFAPPTTYTSSSTPSLYGTGGKPF